MGKAQAMNMAIFKLTHRHPLLTMVHGDLVEAQHLAMWQCRDVED